MKRSSIVFIQSALFLFICLAFSACGGGSSSHPISVVISSSATGNAIDQGQTTTLTATVSNDSTAAGVQWSVSGGGSLSGQTPTSATYNAPASVTAAFTATVTATSVTDSSKSATLQIKVNPLPTIATTTVPAATPGTAYNAVLTVSGGSTPYRWTVTAGTLPPGLTLSGAGTISGVPTGGGSGNVTFKVTDAAGISATQTISFTVNPVPALVITTTSLPGAINGTAYSQTLQASGGVPPYTWSLTAGSLPPGLTLSSAGIISGTPTGTTTTTYHFTVSVTDSETPSAVTQSANLAISVTQPPLSVTTIGLAGGSIGNAYSQSLQAIGGTPPYTWSIVTGSLPAGLTLNSSTGVISGTPTGTGTFNFTVKVTDSVSATATAPLSIVIGSAFTLTTTSLPGGSVGTAYTATLQATGGALPYTWSITSGTLPAGLTLNSSTGVISGTPTTTGTSAFTVQVTDSESPATAIAANFSITISSANCPNNGNLKGNYAFVMNGWSSSVAATSAAGSFVADGSGNISTGLLDQADQLSGVKSGTFTGTYCVASTNLATINLTYGGALSGGNTFIAALDSSDSNGHLISYDNSGRNISGLLRQQTTSAFSLSQITGNFAFGAVGVDQGANRFAMAGEFNSNGTGTLTGENDSDDLGALQSQQTLTSTNFAVPSTGRGTATIATSGGNLHFVFYVVSASEMLMIELDTTDTTPMLLAGQALKQTGPFTDSSLNGTSVIGLQSLGSNGTDPTVLAGLLTTTGNSATYTLSADQNQAGTMSAISSAGTFSVAATGRAVLTPGGAGNTRILYLVSANQAFVVGTNAGADYGLMEPQTTNSFSAASLTGIYLGGSEPPASSSVNEEADNLNSDGAGNITGTSDKDNNGSTQSGTFSATYTISANGRAIVSQSGNPTLYLYMISPSQFIALPISSVQNPNPDPKLIDFHQ